MIMHPAEYDTAGHAKNFRLHAVLLCILFLLLPASCKRSKPAPPPPPQVEVVSVLQKDVPIQREWVGTVDGFVNAAIRAQVTGYLISQDYREGQQVRKGQVLFRIDPRPFQAALNQVQGSLAQAEAQYENAKANLDRVKPLAARRALSRQELDNATAGLRTAQAQVTAARAAVRNAKLSLEFTKIRSPIDGVAGIPQAQVGNLVGPSQTGNLAVVSTLDPVKVYFSVPARDYIDYLKQRSSASSGLLPPSRYTIELLLPDGSVYPEEGKFFALDRGVDPATGTVLVETVFRNPSFLLRPGQFGRVRVTLGTERNALLVPQRAVTELQGRTQVAVVDAGNRVELRDVRTGKRTGDLWIIESGLRPGERVVAEGSQKVKPGATVSPVPFTAQTGTAQPGRAAGGSEAR